MALTHQPPRNAHFLGSVDEHETVKATLVLRRRTDGSLNQTLTHENFHQNAGAHEDDVQQVLAFLEAFKIQVTDVHPRRRVIKIIGSVEAFQQAFATELQLYRSLDGQQDFHVMGRAPTLPPSCVALLGLDKRPLAHSNVKGMRALDTHAVFTTHDNLYNPVDLGHLYQFPPNTDGHGQCIAIIELGGGYTDDNLQAYFQGLGVPMPKVTAIGVAGGVNQTGTGADGEVQLDIEVAGALAPGASYAVYFASNTDDGFHEAISQAAHDQINKPSIISISWGAPEDHWSPQAIQAVQSALEDAVLLGIAVTVAAGDNGAADGDQVGLHADFPASSPSVIACGGTKLIATAEAIAQETVWNEDPTNGGATGGGISQLFPMPAWQAADRVPLAPNGFKGRGVPDVAGVADPDTGYYVKVNGQDQIVGGTSAVAPLWAALIARCYQALGHTVPNLHEKLYSLPATCFRDIVLGNDDGYSAGAGWDPTTGLGSPIGTALLEHLKA